MTNVNTKVIKESKMQLKIVEQYINEKVCKIKKRVIIPVEQQGIS